ncbi:hypothetical protein NUW58_g3646 [Xylaria curta]|uniref:Uncharacterized protein n=1 Tax=Xylaria curta TaxID=42375 RepID=A0ACC1PBB4_9PEZI|nr:hypothetical protein NUW58_g3646 [Xylaria curta]
MANVEFGLAIGFYAYPCGLVVTLLLSQLARYRYSYAGSGPKIDEKATEPIQRFYAKCVWLVQLALTPLLLSAGGGVAGRFRMFALPFAPRFLKIAMGATGAEAVSSSAMLLPVNDRFSATYAC